VISTLAPEARVGITQNPAQTTDGSPIDCEIVGKPVPVVLIERQPADTFVAASGPAFDTVNTNTPEPGFTMLAGPDKDATRSGSTTVPVPPVSPELGGGGARASAEEAEPVGGVAVGSVVVAVSELVEPLAEVVAVLASVPVPEVTEVAAAASTVCVPA
jgi:hypothetical protein